MSYRSSLTDAEMLAGLATGEEAVYVLTLDRYQDAIFRFFIFNHGNTELAEEQTAETFAALVVAAPRLCAKDVNLRAYLYGIARNIKRLHTRQNHEVILPDSAVETIATTATNPRDAAVFRQDIEQAVAAIVSLEEPAREVMLLRYVEDMSLAQISVSLDIPLNSIKSHIHRSLQKVRAIMGVAQKRTMENTNGKR